MSAARSYPGDVKPAQPGVYRTTQPDGSQFFNYFDGCRWSWGRSSVGLALSERRHKMKHDEKGRLVAQWQVVPQAVVAA